MGVTVHTAPREIAGLFKQCRTLAPERSHAHFSPFSPMQRLVLAEGITTDSAHIEPARAESSGITSDTPSRGRKTVNTLHERSRTYLGGISPFVPVAFAAAAIVILLIGERIGSSFFFALAIAGVALIAYSIFVMTSESSTVLHSQVLPFTAGLAAAVGIGASGLGLGGFGDRWDTSSLLLAVLVATGGMAGVRASLAPKQAERPPS